MTASIGGKTRLWTLSEDQISELRRRTEHYRQFRQARAQLVKRQQEMLRLIDNIEKARTRQP
jgi:arginine utilization protein RocB